MKKMVFLILIAISLVSSLSAKTLTFAAEANDQFPYYLGNSTTFDMSKPGMAVEIITAVCKDLGVEAKFKRYPWKRCISNMEKGKVVGIFNASFKEKRLKFGQYPWKNGKVDPSRRIATTAYVLYKHKDSKIKWDGKTLVVPAGKSIGATLGYSIIDDLKKLGAKTDPTKDYMIDLKKVNMNRIPGCVELEISSDFYLNKNRAKFPNIEKVSPPIKVKPYYLMLSHQFIKADPKLSEKIWDGVRDYIASPKYKKLLTKYGL